MEKTVDYIIHSCVAAVLSLGIVGAVIYQVITQGTVNSDLLGWGGIVVGVFVANRSAQVSQGQGQATSSRSG